MSITPHRDFLLFSLYFMFVTTHKENHYLIELDTGTFNWLTRYFIFHWHNLPSLARIYNAWALRNNWMHFQSTPSQHETVLFYFFVI